jgi:hypothetical protein
MARFVCLIAALAAGFQLGAQAGHGKPAGNPPSAPVPAAPAAPQAPNVDDLLAARATPYRPSLQRDPFATPSDADQTTRGDMVDDIAVKGRVVYKGKTMAVVTDSRGNTRMLPIGHRFRDGELVAVGEKTVTFHQWDPSGMNTRVFRTVVKSFKREEGKR